MVTVSDFRTNFPEFSDAPTDAVVQRCLDLAALHSGGFPAGDVQDLAQQYYAAHLITRDPRGQRTAMRPSTGSSTVNMARVQRGDRFDKGTSPYLQAYLDLRAAYIIPITIS